MNKPTKHVGFNEFPDIIAEIDAVAQSEGQNRTSFIRQTIRQRLNATIDSGETKK